MESVSPVTQPVHVRRRNRDTTWNILTLVFLLATMCMALAFLVVFINPQVPFNPFPPPVLAMQPAQGAEPTQAPTTASTATPTRTVFPATWTPEPTIPVMTDTPVPQDTPTSSVPTPIVEVSPGSVDFTFAMHGTPAPVSTTLIKNEVGCNWMGAAGQALDLQGRPIIGLLIKVSGTLAGKPLDLISMTGTETRYGDGGYEITLADRPLDSRGELTIQLLDQASLPLSQAYTFDTVNDCKKNLILINFRQIKE